MNRRPSRAAADIARSPDRSALQLAVAIIILATTVALGTVGYIVIESWSLGDALYMTVISITTTGFREVRDLSGAGRALTAIIIISGLASLAYVGGRVLQVAVEIYLYRRTRMDRRIGRLKNHVVLCGFGRMGRHIAVDLHEAGTPFVVIEQDPDAAAQLEADGYLYIIGSASSDTVLKQAGVDRATGLIAVVSTDAENVYTTLTAKSLSPKIRIVARALGDESESKLRTAGADRVVKPYEMVGRRIAQLVIRPGMIEFVDTIARSRSGEITMEEITVDESSALVNVTLRETPIRQDLNVIIVAIRKPNDELMYNPGPDARVEAGDRLVAIGKSEQIEKLGKLCGVA